jgi:ankyrin repeat protein
MEHLMDDGVDVNSTNKRGTSALYEAARSWQCEAVKFLISRGADVNAKDKYGDTPMYSVVFNSFSFTLSEDYVEIISTLLKHGADVNYHRSNTRSLLANVEEKITEPATDSRKLQLEACKLMLKAGAHIDDNTNVAMGYTPLHVAIDTRNDELLTLLLDEGNSVQITAAMEITDNRGRTPIKLAQERGYGKAVVILHHHLNKRHIQEDMASAVMVQLGDVASEEYQQFERNARRFR